MFEPSKTTRLGLGYRSKVSHELSGSVHFELDSAGVGAALSGATGAFVDTGAKASFTAPESVSFGIYHEITPKWALSGEVAWTHWSRFNELRIRFDNPAQSDSVTDESWTNQWFYALGVTYRPNQRWTWRAGVAYEDSPVPDRTRTPRIPGNDRFWLAFGGRYQVLPNFDIDFGYTHIFAEDGDIDLTTSGTGNTFRGNLSGTFENAIDIVTVQAKYRF